MWRPGCRAWICKSGNALNEGNETCGIQRRRTLCGTCWIPCVWSPWRRASISAPLGNCPGAIQTELLNTIAPSETKTVVEEFYRNVDPEPETIADAVLYAVSQPDQVEDSDLAVRPTKES